MPFFNVLGNYHLKDKFGRTNHCGIRSKNYMNAPQLNLPYLNRVPSLRVYHLLGLALPKRLLLFI